MPRDKGGIGRTGKKHKKPATHDVYRQLKAEPVEGAAPAASLAVERLVEAREAAQAALEQHAQGASAQESAAEFEPPPIARDLRSVRERKGIGKPRRLYSPRRRLPSRAERDAERHETLMRYRRSNDWCMCAEIPGNHPVPGDPNFKEHSMFCPIYLCYAYEIGCCDGIEYSHEVGQFHGDAFHSLCECISPVFGDPLSGCLPQLRQRYQHNRDPRPFCSGPKQNEKGLYTFSGRSLKQCPIECPCWAMTHDSVDVDLPAGWGRYIPTCPFRPHGVSGRARGEHEAERRGHAIQWGPCANQLFGAHLPPPPPE